MANYIRISTLGSVTPKMDERDDNRKVADLMNDHWRKKLELVLPDQPDLVVLPEVCDEPLNFSRERKLEYYHERGDRVLDAFREVARTSRCYMVYSAIREMSDGTSRNASIVIDRRGEIAGIYHKNFVTLESGAWCGKEAPIIECDFGRVACIICFDLNFRELLDKYAAAKPDLLIFSSLYHGGLMQGYWAYQCRAHFVGAVMNLPCEIRDPLGEVIAHTTNYLDYATVRVNLDCRLIHLDYNWEKLNLLKQKYGSKVTIKDPGLLGCVLLSSEDENLSVMQMIDEFGIELWDDYYARAVTFRHTPGNMEV